VNSIESLKRELEEQKAMCYKRFKEQEIQIDQLTSCYLDTTKKMDQFIDRIEPVLQFLEDVEATGRMADRVKNVVWLMVKIGTLFAGVIAWYELIVAFIKNSFTTN
jgi:hypothetical protein